MRNFAVGTTEASSGPYSPQSDNFSLGPILNHHAKLNCVIFPLTLFGKQPFLQWKKKIKGLL